MRIFTAVRRWLWPWRVWGVAAVGLWIFVMAQLVRNKSLRGAKPLEELFPWAVQKALATGSDWMGVYLKGRKIGYTRNVVHRLEDEYSISQHSLMQMQLFGKLQRIRLSSEVRVSHKYRLKQFSYRLDSGFSLFEAEGYVHHEQLHITLKTAGFRRKMFVKYKPALLASVLRPYIAAQRPPPGQRIAALLFDPQSMAYTKTIISIENYENIVIKGKTYRALRMRQRFRGIDLLAWLDGKGRVLKELSPTGLTLVRETPLQAKQGIEGSFDILRATRIAVHGHITHPETRPSLRVKLENVPLASFLGLNLLRQRLEGKVLHIHKTNIKTLPRLKFVQHAPLSQTPKRPTPPSQPIAKITPSSRPNSPMPTSKPSALSGRHVGLPTSHPIQKTPNPSRSSATSRRSSASRPHQAHFSLVVRERVTRDDSMPSWQIALLQQASAATPWVQSDHPNIQRHAYKLTLHARDRIDALKKIAKWMFRSIRKQSVVGIPSALETLQTRIGDCNEHATLFAALARAVDIPCTITSGIAYQRGNFYFHAWNECFVGGQTWVAIDTTWGQFPADVTHIAFVRGGLDKQAGLLQLLGKLSVHILPEHPKK